LVQAGSGQYSEEVETDLQPMKMKEKCIQKQEFVQIGSGHYTEELQPGMQPMRMKEKCIQKRIVSGWIWPIYRRSEDRLATNENEGEMHSKTELVQTGSGQYSEEEDRIATNETKEKCMKNEIGSDWIWPKFGRSGNSLATDENEGEMHSKTKLVQTGSGQYSEELQPGLQPMRMKEKCIQKQNWFKVDLANIQNKCRQACNQ
jgi:hypothetical protein